MPTYVLLRQSRLRADDSANILILVHIGYTFIWIFIPHRGHSKFKDVLNTAGLVNYEDTPNGAARANWKAHNAPYVCVHHLNAIMLLKLSATK